MTIRDGDLDRPEIYIHSQNLSKVSALDSPASSVWPDSPGTTPLTTNVKFRPLCTREDGKVFGPSWTTKWFRLGMQFSKDNLRKYKDRLALKWNSNSEALLYTATGTAITAFTGGDGDDKRDMAYLLSSLPAIKNTIGVSSPNFGKASVRADSPSGNS